VRDKLEARGALAAAERNSTIRVNRHDVYRSRPTEIHVPCYANIYVSIGAPRRTGAIPTLQCGVVIHVGTKRKVGGEGDLSSMRRSVET